MIKIVEELAILSILMPYSLSSCFPSPLFLFPALLLNSRLFYDFSFWLCENRNPWNLFLFNLISFHLSTSASYLNTVGVMSPFCPICFPHTDVSCELRLSSLGVLISYCIEFNFPLIIKRKKCCQSNWDVPSMMRETPISVMLRGWKQMCIYSITSAGFQNTSYIKSNYSTVEESVIKHAAFHAGQRSSGTYDISWKHASGLIHIVFCSKTLLSF